MSGVPGTGTGTVDYQIENQDPVNAKQCTVQALEDDAARTLTLAVAFTDANLGAVHVGIGVYDYSPQTSLYDQIGSMAITMGAQTPLGGWASTDGSTVRLTVSVSGSAPKTYSGTFDAGNLMWVGQGTEDSLTIKFSTYTFQVSAS